MELKEEILARLPQASKIEIVQWNGQRYWLKQASNDKRTLRLKLLNGFARVNKLPIIKAVPKATGSDALLLETERINQLKAKGIMVPEVVAQGDGWILLSDLGCTISSYYKNSDPSDIEPRRELFLKVLAAIQQVHQSGAYLSQSVVRNITINEQQQVGFIDFEDDPGQYMDLEQAMARDLLLFSTSCARFFTQDAEFFVESLRQHLTAYSATVSQYLASFANKFRWVCKIPFSHKLGSDLAKLQLAIRALQQTFIISPATSVSH